MANLLPKRWPRQIPGRSKLVVGTFTADAMRAENTGDDRPVVAMATGGATENVVEVASAIITPPLISCRRGRRGNLSR